MSRSWLIQVARWFAEIPRRRLPRGVFKSADALIAAMADCIAANKQPPKSLSGGQQVQASF
jgi:hypothetical protein